MMRSDILIIGGGLTGLTLAYLLRESDLKVLVIEARSRLGGRIMTKGGQDQACIEMGATWLGPAHQTLQHLLNELGLETFKQKLGDKAIYEPTSMSPHQLVSLPPQQQPSYRIEGGTMNLIRSLTSYLKDEDVILGQPVKKITAHKNFITVDCLDTTYESKMVVSTLPPKLLYDTVEFQPQLPENVANVISSTHTWMGDSIKFGFSFEDAFWLEENTSGTLFSNVGPVTEMYDHTTKDGHKHAIKGFINSNYFSVSENERRQMILKQLRKYYGDVVDKYTAYHELVWTNEPFTYTPYDHHVLPHQNNGHEIFKDAYFDHRFFIAGAETSEISPGYMDGAVCSAIRVFEKLTGDS